MPPRTSALLDLALRGAFHTTAFLCGLLSIRSVVCDVQKVTGSSMAPTISPDYDTAGSEDTILVSKIRSGLRDNNEDGSGGGQGAVQGSWEYFMRNWNIHRLSRGDIVTFWSPSGQPSLKRVIALGGDEVQPERRVRFGKGYRLPEPGDAVEDTTNGMPPKFTVPYGHLWLEGDNPNTSQDSRDFGPISHALVIGKAMAILNPSQRARWVEGKRPIRKTSTKVTPGVSERPLVFDD